MTEENKKAADDAEADLVEIFIDDGPYRAPKGGNLLHTIRQLVDDDELWKEILRGLNERFRHQIVTSAQIEAYIIEESDKKLSLVFDQYLRHAGIPTFQYALDGGALHYRWVADVEGFDMRIRVWTDGLARWLEPTSEWQEVQLGPDASGDDEGFAVDPNFYVEVEYVDPR